MRAGRNHSHNHSNTTPNPVFPNPKFWAIAQDFVSKFGKAQLFTVECAGFDHWAEKYNVTSDNEAVNAYNKGKVEEGAKHNADQRQLQHNNLTRQVEENPASYEQKTIYYGASQHPETMLAYIKLHPHLKNNASLIADVENLIKYVNDPNPDKVLPQAQSKHILLVEYWRLIPEIAERRRIAHERFRWLYLSKSEDDAYNAYSQGMLDELVEDAKSFFESRPGVLAAEKNNVKTLFEIFLSNPTNNPAALINHLSPNTDPDDNKEQRAQTVYGALDFLLQEIIDVMAMQRFKIPSLNFMPTEVPKEEEKWAWGRICHSLKPNRSMELMLRHANELGLEIPMPEHWFLPYLVVAGQVTKAFTTEGNFKFNQADFEEDQARQLESMQKSAMAKLVRTEAMKAQQHKKSATDARDIPSAKSAPTSRAGSPPDQKTTPLTERTSSLPNMPSGTTTTQLLRRYADTKKEQQEIADQLYQKLESKRQKLRFLEQVYKEIQTETNDDIAGLLKQLIDNPTNSQAQDRMESTTLEQRSALPTIKGDLNNTELLVKTQMGTFNSNTRHHHPQQQANILNEAPSPSEVRCN